MDDHLTKDIEDAIRKVLPSKYHKEVPSLAALISSVIEGKLQPQELEQRIRDNIKTQRALSELEGRTLETTHAVVSIGKGSQTGDVTHRDVAGRDFISITVNPAGITSKLPPEAEVAPPKNTLAKRTLLYATLLTLGFGLGLGLGLSAMYWNAKFDNTLTNASALTKRSRVFTFEDRQTGDWQPFIWNNGYAFFEDSGEFSVTDDKIELIEHLGPFLRYNLDLDSPSAGYPKTRSAISLPVSGEVYSIIANVYYEPNLAYEDGKVFAGFFARDNTGINESHMQLLKPREWNTVIWSLYSPFFPNENDQKEFNQYASRFGSSQEYMQIGRNLRKADLNLIGIQFYTVADEQKPQTKFKGRVYIDNITIIKP